MIVGSGWDGFLPLSFDGLQLVALFVFGWISCAALLTILERDLFVGDFSKSRVQIAISRLQTPDSPVTVDRLAIPDPSSPTGAILAAADDMRGHKYLTVVVDHDRGVLLWAHPGRDQKTLERFFDRLGPERCAQITLVSADAAEWIANVVAERCANAELCMDPFHVVQWATAALDEVRREVWNAARRSGQKAVAKDLKGARYALSKNPEDLTVRQGARLASIAKTNHRLYRAYLLNEPALGVGVKRTSCWRARAGGVGGGVRGCR